MGEGVKGELEVVLLLLPRARSPSQHACVSSLQYAAHLHHHSVLPTSLRHSSCCCCCCCCSSSLPRAPLPLQTRRADSARRPEVERRGEAACMLCGDAPPTLEREVRAIGCEECYRSRWYSLRYCLGRLLGHGRAYVTPARWRWPFAGAGRSMVASRCGRESGVVGLSP